MARSLSVIASEIRKTWKPVDGAARPYLEAMSELETVNDMYGCEKGSSMVNYFLSNAGKFKGPDGARIKAELRAALKGK